MERAATVKLQAQAAKTASYKLAGASGELKNKALAELGLALKARQSAILAANERDLEAAEKNNELSPSLKKRLRLDEKKLDGLIQGLKDLAALPDPVGHTLLQRELDQGLMLYKVSVPIGTIGVIFESRPDALIQIASLCIKSGNAVLLKGGQEARQTNSELYQAICQALEQTDPLFTNSVQLMETREEINELLKLDEYIDLMIPRGSNQLVRYIKEHTKIPVLGHADGICHMYLDAKADMEMALNVTYDAKCQYAAVCNAIETLLVHKTVAPVLLPRLQERFKDVELRGDEQTRAIIPIKAATDEDWSTEYNDLILSIKIVSSLAEAVEHINRYGSHHTDGIITDDKAAAEEFMNLVDSSSVMWNCSTRFADGFRYGFGAEVGISTNKIHARGPVGLEGLTIYKFKLIGSGQPVAPYAEGKKQFHHKTLKG